MSQPNPYYPAPVAPPPPPKKSKAPLIIGIVAAVVLVLCGGAVACFAVVGAAVNDAANSLPTGFATNPGAIDPGTTDPGTESTPGANDDPTPVAVGLNQPARDGLFEFTVTKVQCGISQVGSGFLIKKAQGQFCKVFVKVKNIGNEARTFHDSNQYAYNAAGQKYDADGAAGIYLGESNAFLEDINPGNSVNGIVIFDIPKGAKIVKVELHDSSFSDGVVVKV